MKIVEKTSPNCEYGRQKYKPEAFVIHTTGGETAGAIEWCTDPVSTVSYHYIIDPFGDAWELVKPENTAWHAGKILNPTWSDLKYGINPNYYTIGIAFGGFATDGPNLKQFLSIAELLRSLAVIHNIPLDRKHVVGHYEIRADKVCPGPLFNIDALIYLARLK